MKLTTQGLETRGSQTFFFQPGILLTVKLQGVPKVFIQSRKLALFSKLELYLKNILYMIAISLQTHRIVSPTHDELINTSGVMHVTVLRMLSFK